MWKRFWENFSKTALRFCNSFIIYYYFIRYLAIILNPEHVLQTEGVWSIRTSELLLPTRIRALLASHACRSAVMFGKELDPPALLAVCFVVLLFSPQFIVVPSLFVRVLYLILCRVNLIMLINLSLFQYVIIGSTFLLSQLVRQLAAVSWPWGCAHGRPTIRHLTALTADPHHLFA